MDLSGGPLLQSFAKVYKDMAKEKNPNMDSVSLAKEAITIFDEESDSNKKSTYQQVKNQAEQRKAEKKAKKAKKASTESVTSTSVTSVSSE